MNWFPGWSDPLFRFYSLFFVVLISVIGLILFPLRKKEKVERIWFSFRPWLIMGPLVLLSVGLGREVFIGALLLLSIVCVKEFAKATGLYEDWGFVAVIYLGVFGFYFSAWAKWYGLFAAMPVYTIIVLFMMPAFRNQYKNMIQKVALSTIAVIYLGWFPAHLGFLAAHPQAYAYILFLIIGTELNDASAFISGKLFGKHKLVPEISPNKTIEGTLGALLVTSAYVFLLRPWLPGFSISLTALTIIIIWVGGTMGDLVISFVKRDIGVKDMGSLIPGHGGLLDRVDSLIFVSPLYFHMISHYVRFPGGLL